MDECIKPLLERIDALLRKTITVIVAIDGNSGAGKTSLANQLQQIYPANVFHMDDFFLRPEQRTAARLQEIGGNVDYERFKVEVLDQIGKVERFMYRKFDCHTGKLSAPIEVVAKPLNIVEGVYSMHPTLVNRYDVKVFLTVDKELQQQRILMRNGPVMLQRFIKEWIPLENRYFQAYSIKELSDFVFSI